MKSETEHTGTHVAHCCVLHGCKYGDDDCPVASGEIGQAAPCEQCPVVGGNTLELLQIMLELLQIIRRRKIRLVQYGLCNYVRYEIRRDIEPTGVSVAYLVLVVDGQSLLYMRIPDSIPDDVVAMIVAKLNT